MQASYILATDKDVAKTSQNHSKTVIYKLTLLWHYIRNYRIVATSVNASSAINEEIKVMASCFLSEGAVK
jgi:hypothetical protein